jgi:hypothetical protein
MQFCFVSTRRGSYFMTELLSAIAAATEEAGHHVEVVFDEFPSRQDACVYVVIPHEFRAWGDPAGSPDDRQRARTVALCTENPGTPWFEETCELAPQFALAVSINRSSAAELGRRGIPCEHVQLGYSPLWDSWRRDENVERNIDVLYLGAADPRRDPLIAGLGKDLWARQCQLLIPPLEPRTRPRPDFVQGADKYERLRSAKILLNLHRTTSAAFEWMRFLESICNGCVVVSEPCLDSDPLIAGEHFIAVSVEGIARTVNDLLDDPDRLQLMRTWAYDFVRETMPMATVGQQLAELAGKLPLRPNSPPSNSQTPTPSSPASRTEVAPAEARTSEAQMLPAVEESRADPHASRASVRERGRLFGRITARLLGDRRNGLQTIDETPAYARAAPRITVAIVTLCDREREAVQALGTIATSLHNEFDVLVLDHPLSGRPATAVRHFIDDHPSLPARVLRQPVDRGFGHSRNTLVEQARGEYLFMLDATGGIYPSTLQRLATALDGDPRAIFAYSMVGVFEGDRPVELVSSLPWEPERLKSGNWIDGMALIRRTRLLGLGGYATDPRLAGWEDFDLWCRCAQAGGHGVHVPQVLAWRRRTASSAAAHGEDGTPAKWALMRERFPQLLAPPGGG